MVDKSQLREMMARDARRTAPEPGDTPHPMSREARGDAPTWRKAEPSYRHGFTLPLDDRRHRLLRQLALDLDTSAAVLLRVAIDLLAAKPELLEDLRPTINDETRALRRRR